MPSTAARLVQEAKSIFAQADNENRPLSPEERSYCDDLLARAEEQGAFEQKFVSLGDGLGPSMGNTKRVHRRRPADGPDPG